MAMQNLKFDEITSRDGIFNYYFSNPDESTTTMRKARL